MPTPLLPLEILLASVAVFVFGCYYTTSIFHTVVQDYLNDPIFRSNPVRLTEEDD